MTTLSSKCSNNLKQLFPGFRNLLNSILKLLVGLLQKRLLPLLTRVKSVPTLMSFLDSIFMMLYNELFYRHLYAHVTSFPELEEAHQSYLNYCALFDALLSMSILLFYRTCWSTWINSSSFYFLEPKNPVQLELPNQWLWDIIDEFIYQFQKFSTYRSKLKRKPEDDAFLGLNPSTWSIQGVLGILFQLVEKSNINLQLSYYAMQREQPLTTFLFYYSH